MHIYIYICYTHINIYIPFTFYLFVGPAAADRCRHNNIHNIVGANKSQHICNINNNNQIYKHYVKITIIILIITIYIYIYI